MKVTECLLISTSYDYLLFNSILLNPTATFISGYNLNSLPWALTDWTDVSLLKKEGKIGYFDYECAVFEHILGFSLSENLCHH